VVTDTLLRRADREQVVTDSHVVRESVSAQPESDLTAIVWGYSLGAATVPRATSCTDTTAARELATFSADPARLA